jgi:LPS-assembly lipoprotein
MSTRAGRRWFCLGGTALLAGCGFQPVYMPTASNKAGPAQREMAQVNVPVIPDRPGQLLRQALQRELRSDSGGISAYDLRVVFAISGEGISVLNDNIATRVRMIGTASWSLVDRNPQQTLLTSGSARSMDGLNVFNEQYFAADLETEAVQKRIADNVAQQIAIQLAIWFRERAAREAKSS